MSSSAALVRDRARDAGERRYLVFEDDAYTFADTYAHACRYANLFLGLRDDTRPFHVGLLLENRPEFVFAELGAALMVTQATPQDVVYADGPYRVYWRLRGTATYQPFTTPLGMTPRIERTRCRHRSRGARVELPARFSGLTGSPQFRIIAMRSSPMKAMLSTMAVLTLLVGISGCYPVRNWHGDWRGDQNWRGDERRHDRRIRGDRPQRDDCWRRDGRWYCPEND